MDDGKRNALGIAAFEELIAAFDHDDDAAAVVLAGREDVFTAGLDMKFMARATPREMADLLVVFGRALMRIWTDPRPVVCAATGHAVAAGTMLAMACDHAVAAEGEYWWGLTETRIDFEMPGFGIVLARHNVRADRVDDLILPGARVTAAEAVAVGFADESAPRDAVVARAQERARERAELPAGAYAGTKRRLRQAAADQVLAGLEDDIAALVARTHI